MKRTDALILERSACLAIIASAMEVFPRECVGLIFKSGERSSLALAIPMQVANRRRTSVVSNSLLLFSGFNRCKNFTRFCGYHSHPYSSNESECAVEPSKCDMDGIEVGEIEIIVNVRRRRKKKNSWKQKDGNILIRHGQFCFVVSAFMRLSGKMKRFPLYKRVGLSLGKDDKTTL